MEQSKILDGLRKIAFFRLFISIPFLVEMRLTLHLVSDLFEHFKLFESLYNRPHRFRDEI